MLSTTASRRTPAEFAGAAQRELSASDLAFVVAGTAGSGAVSMRTGWNRVKNN